MGLAAVVAAAAVGITSAQADPGPATPVSDVLAPGVQAPAAPSPSSLAAQALLSDLVGGALTVDRRPDGLARSVGVSGGGAIPLPAGLTSTAPASEQALAHLRRAAALFGLDDVATQLRLVPQDAAIAESLPELQVVRFEQVLAGVPVLGGEIVVVLDFLGALKSITAELLPEQRLAPSSTIAASKARQIALAAVRRANPDVRPAALGAADPELWFLDPALIGFPASSGLRAGHVWRTEVADREAVRELVLVDATTGALRLQLDTIAHANRVVCDRANKSDPSALGRDCTPTYARAEGEAAKPGAIDANQAYDFTGDASEFFDDYLGVNLTKLLGLNSGDGKRLQSTVQYCPGDTLCEASAGNLFENAFWNGRGMFYGKGWTAADDIVAHELTHGVTEKTARLLYLYQSGAISESMSDIFGELVDLTNGVDGSGGAVRWAAGEDAPLDQIPIRNMADPTQTLLPLFGQPDRMTSGSYAHDVFFVDNGGVHDNSGVGNKAAFLIADGSGGAAFNGQTVTGIGLARTAKVFYQALRMLTSGADYADLGAVLPQACNDLLGLRAKGEIISKTHCDQVRKAVKATEMAEQPPAPSRAPEADFCPKGTKKSKLLSDSFENFSTKRWSLGKQWRLVDDYAKTGVNSLYGVEPDRTLSSAATLKTAVAIPKSGQTFLRFAHQYRLDHFVLETGLVDRYYDGAVLEFRIGKGSWKSASGRPWQNGPDKRIQPDGGRAYDGFGGDSNGYNSSRLNLTSLGGKKLQFRWAVKGDKQIKFDGWTIDDVQFFQCRKR
ncbi:MAG: M4 family metallopeptidase [Sporichthyaceae bacterium]